MNLVIVESPTKARKLKAYLGANYQVEASVGHVRDLPSNELGIDLENSFEPKYVVSDDKKKVIKQLKNLASDAKVIVLAMDPDREGEAIAWHVQYLLSEKQKNPPQFLRATFHEITKLAVLEAIDHPGELNMALVDAQQARRVLDRLVGYQISPVLWKKVRRGLSAGRVQSVALRLVVEREREIEAFNPEEYWQIEVALAGLDSQTAINKTQANSKYFLEGKAIDHLPADLLIANLEKVNGKKFGEPVFTKAQAEPIIASLQQANYQIVDVEKKERKRNSLPPFTTSLLQQNSASRLGFSAKQTMSLAQQLYEEGLITYHRTDSFNLSASSLDMARKYIVTHFGKAYLPEKPQVFRSKSKNAQEAHEAIRVTDINLLPEQILAKSRKFTGRHVKLYDLIWKRFLASQMTSAVYDQTTVQIEAQEPAKTDKYLLKAVGSIMRFDGWTKLFSNSEDCILPAVEAGQTMAYLDINPLQKYTQPPARYNDASLIKELEKRGIGRPSTYASIISVIIDRAYVERVDKRFFATPVGKTVSDFLLEHFPNIMDYDFTAEMEEDLDRIALGQKQWRTIVANFWQPLDKQIDQVVEKADRAQIPVEKTGEPCPDCGQTDGGEIVIRSGKYGKFKSCSRYPECKFTQNIVEKVEGMLCPLCQKGEVIMRKSRWGKAFFGCSLYPQCNWASWQKPEPGLIITPEEWEKQQAVRAEKAKARKAKWAEKKPKKAGKGGKKVGGGGKGGKEGGKKTSGGKKAGGKKTVAKNGGKKVADKDGGKKTEKKASKKVQTQSQ